MRSIRASGCDGHHSSLWFAFRSRWPYLRAMPPRRRPKDTAAKLAKRMSRRCCAPRGRFSQRLT